MAVKLKPQNTSAQELKFAYRLLLKLHGQVNNSYLLLAIIAWARENAKVSRLRWSSEAALNRAVSNWVRIFSSSKYRLVLQAIRHAPVKNHEADQALDFFYAAIDSPWGLKHYGFFGVLPLRLDPNWLFITDLYKRWNNLLGHIIKMPADTIPQPKPKKAPPPPPPPPRPKGSRAGLHNIPAHGYIEPYGARDFYDSRREAPQAPDMRPEW